MLNIVTLLFVFIVFNTGKGQFDVANLVITTAIVEALLAVEFHCTWSCPCLVHGRIMVI